MTTPQNPPAEPTFEEKVLAAIEGQNQRFDAIEQRLHRLPVKELTAEEKAQEYDRLVASGDLQNGPGPAVRPAGPGAPPSGDSGDYWDDATAETYRKRLGEWDAARRPPGPELDQGGGQEPTSIKSRRRSRSGPPPSGSPQTTGRHWLYGELADLSRFLYL